MAASDENECVPVSPFVFQFEAGRRPGLGLAPIALQDDPPSGRDEAGLGDGVEGRLRRAQGVWGIGEHQIELRAELPDRALDVFAQQRAPLGTAQLVRIALDDLRRLRVRFDEGGVDGAARESLERERPRSRVQIEDAQPVAALPQSIEKALPDAICGRPRRGPAHRVESPTAQVAADDPHSFWANAASRFKRRGAVLAAPARPYSSCAS